MLGETVLIVDDSLTVRMDLASAFAEAGFRPVTSTCVAEARQQLARVAAGVIVLDVVLPDGDGIELLEEVRAERDGTKPVVLVLSTEAEVEDRVRGIRTGADEYVGKPYDSGYVVARARELLRARQMTTPASANVLLIDDSPTFRAHLAAALEGEGYTVATAADGESGLRMAADLRPAAVIVDGVLPGIDGMTVIRRLRLDAALRDVPCLLLTDSADADAELGALDAGADGFARKEEDSTVLLAKLSAALRWPVDSMDAGRPASLQGPKKILAVDDSETQLQHLAESLRSEDFDVILARSGREAFQLLGVQAVDCILMDLNMPELDGRETCRLIKSVPGVREIPLIMLTADEGQDALLQCLGSGADDYVPKSGGLDVLRARVRSQIRRKQLEDENRRFREHLLRNELDAAEARAARELAETRAALVCELERKNAELEAFCYSVSHDLRAPLRSINGFTRALVEDCAGQLDEAGLAHLDRVLAASARMDQLIGDLLQLSRFGRAELKREILDLSGIARAVTAELGRVDPGRDVTLAVEDGLVVHADHRLMHVVMDNLLGNAWKFTAYAVDARIEVGSRTHNLETVYHVRDNGAGFEMKYADQLFMPFRRLHPEREFPGTGIGLATVRRVVERHGGRVWAEASPGLGAAFYFTVPDAPGHGE